MDIKPGQIGWLDITVPDAESLKEFYTQVVGWETSPVEMEGYRDHCMLPPGSDAPVAGICHARGENAALPAQWIVYIAVANLERGVDRCKALGGAVIAPVREGGGGRYVVIRDPAGAVCALYEKTD